MIIQHNIMAMNAYRNYKTNTSALSANLEKLSSGYKINRAGDDAAGLAISEKMRAQITGLEAAQKNVKDGISLVKTAEGAMQEIQDMLNRMDYLATQSANGTYDNEVDRYNLQKEVNQLRSEIDRIADSANFNGIKLLDGSLDVKATDVGAADANPGTVTSLVSSSVGSTLGTDTVLHTSGNEATTTKFAVDLHEVTFSNENGKTLTLQIGTDTFTLDGNDGGEMSAADIAEAFAKGQFKAGGSGMTTGQATVNTGTFTVKNNGTRIEFEQDDTEDPVTGDLDVTVKDAAAGAATQAVAAVYDSKTVNKVTDNTANNLSIGGYSIQVDGTTMTDLADQLAAFVTAYNNDAANDEWTASLNDDGDGIKFTAKQAGTLTTTGATAPTGTQVVTAGADAGAAPDSSVTGDYNKKTTVTQEGQAAGDKRIASGVVTLAAKDFADGTIIKIGDKDYTITTDAANQSKTDMVYVGDLDVSTNAGLKSAIDRLTVKADSNSVWTVGQGTTVGEVTFAEKVDKDGKSYTDLNTENGKLKDGAFDLTKEAVIKETFGTVTGKTDAVVGEAGKPLTLQIGDTSDEYNQLKVGVGDMHVAAMGVMKRDSEGAPDGVDNNQSIANIDISTREGASAAIDVIKAAINYVSGIRGDLGATQNRLEHTANNLSVMAENITDAESTIRDTDVAEEMMAYTKNNILVQSAQAMLAQANAVPQGVLQLLG